MHLSGTRPEKDSSANPLPTAIGLAAPGMEVSWQISGVRHDPSVQLYRNTGGLVMMYFSNAPNGSLLIK